MREYAANMDLGKSCRREAGVYVGHSVLGTGQMSAQLLRLGLHGRRLVFRVDDDICHLTSFFQVLGRF